MTGKCKYDGPTLALQSKRTTDCLSIDKSCDKPDCPRCFATVKTEIQQNLATFLTQHGSVPDGVSVLRCTRRKWDSYWLRTFKRKYDLTTGQYALLRFKEQTMVLATVALPALEALPIPEAFEQGKAFVRAMNPTGPYQVTANIPEEEEDEEEEEDKKFGVLGVTGKKVRQHREILDRHEIVHETPQKILKGTMDAEVWDGGISRLKKARVLEDMDLRVKRRKRQPIAEESLIPLPIWIPITRPTKEQREKEMREKQLELFAD